MAEIVEYRVDKTKDELKLLVDFGLFTKEHAKEILTKREGFEYVLRRRTKTKLDYLKYIKYEINLMESIEKYKWAITEKCQKTTKKSDKIEEIDRKILLLQAKKLNDVVRSRCAHISSLFRKLTTSFQFDKKLWLAYIEFAKGRSWNTRATALYWRLLRVASDDEEIWVAAASHEVEVNKAYDTARGLYFRALRHHPESPKIWAAYYKMELKYQEVIQQRARIIFKTTNSDASTGDNDGKNRKNDETIWADDSEFIEAEGGDEKEEKDEPVPKVEVIDKEDKVLSGHLAKVVYDNALQALKEESRLNEFKAHVEGTIEDDKDPSPRKKPKKGGQSKLEILYNFYETKGLEETRRKFVELEKSVRNQTLSFYVGMIQIENWQLAKDKSEEQLNRIRSLYNKAILKFGKIKPKVWYEYIAFEYEHAKSLEQFERINQLYTRAQATLEPSKVNRVIEKFTLLQASIIEYSDYSDLDD